jgi:hypothetical protein
MRTRPRPDRRHSSGAAGAGGGADQPNAVDRWHVQPDMTVIYERRPGQFEEARVLTASTLRDSPLWIEVPPGGTQA